MGVPVSDTMSERDGSPVSPLTVGLDVGASKTAACVLDREGTVRFFERYATETTGSPDHVIASLAALIERCREEVPQPVRAVGVGAAGQVDRAEGILRASPNVDWDDVPVGRALRERVGVPVVVANDVDAATRGEAAHGAGTDTEHLLGVFVGTGVGVGAISEGRLITGCSASALEFGHVTVEAEGRSCSCRSRGCLEAYVGGWALAERAREAARRDPGRAGALLDEAGSIDAVRGEHVAACFERDDGLAVELVEETARYLAVGLVGMVNVLHPCVVVLGGGVIRGIPELVELVRDPVESRCFPVFAESLDVRRSRLGERAGAVGAAVLARDRFRDAF